MTTALVRPVGAYFVLVFGAGFVLGPMRVLWLVPAVGVRAAELLEMPVMLMVILFAARWVVRHFGLVVRWRRSLVGALALALLVTTELSLAWLMQGLGPLDYVANRDAVAGPVYAAMLVVFGVMPAIVGHRGDCPGNDRRPGVP